MRYALDTNIWLYSAAHPDFAAIAADFHPVGLSAVVASELLRCKEKTEAKRFADEITATFAHAIVAPTVDDWLRVGEVMQRVRGVHRYDNTGLARLQSDALIAVSSSRVGWTVVTTNRLDFERIGEVLGDRAPKMSYLDAPKAK